MSHHVSIATWNAGNRRGSWSDVLELPVDVALLQEMPPPPSEHADRTVFSAFSPAKPGGWGTAIWSPTLPIEEISPATSRLGPSYPGTVAAAEIRLPTGGLLTAASIHAVDEKVEFRLGDRSRTDGYAATVMHRALCDLTGYLDDRRRRGARGYRGNITALGGDFNINPGWDGRQKNSAHRLVLDRIEDFGLRSVVPVLTDDTHATCIRRGRPIPFRQIDYLFLSENVAEVEPGILRTPELEARADHLPVIARLAAP